jgi:hypothetical protein
VINPIFTLAAASSAVKALIGSNPMRFWPFREAPQPGQPGYGLPYGVHQLAYGSPTAYLGTLPDSDLVGIQVDAYASKASEADELMRALRDSVESRGYVVAYTGEDRESSTGLFRSGFTVEFWADR